MIEDALSGVRVLIVDDNADNLDMLKVTLELSGARVLAATSAAAAFDVLERETVDVLVTDLAMPFEDGYDLLRSVRKEHPDCNGFVPAVALSCHTSREARERTKAAGFRAHVAKPVDQAELISVIRALAND